MSGDYYDFIPLRNERLMLAVGDISGKGISAALLMATVHAFVRAYSLEPQRRWSRRRWFRADASAEDSCLTTAICRRESAGSSDR